MCVCVLKGVGRSGGGRGLCRKSMSEQEALQVGAHSDAKQRKEQQPVAGGWGSTDWGEGGGILTNAPQERSRGVMQWSRKSEQGVERESERERGPAGGERAAGRRRQQTPSSGAAGCSSRGYTRARSCRRWRTRPPPGVLLTRGARPLLLLLLNGLASREAERGARAEPVQLKKA